MLFRSFREASREGSGTADREATRARRPDRLVFTCGHPHDGGAAGCQGGQQSGAAGEVPLANTKFADRRVNDRGEEFPTDNRQAEVAMDWLLSQAEGPDATAARHTDARSLAVPVPRGTMIPTRRKVYAFLARVRILFP